MRHIILAAGKGIRLLPATLELPKVLLKVGSTTLLANQVDVSSRLETISQIVVVTGYLSEAIEAYVRELGNDRHVSTIFNENFEINNPIYSLYAVIGPESTDDLLITNGDVYYGQALIRQILSESKTGITMAISHYRDHSGRAMTVHVSDGRMVSIYPHAPESNAFESPGIVVVKGDEARNVFYHSMVRLYKRHLGQPHFWHDILNEAKLELPIQTHLISDESWGEVDTASDLALLNTTSGRINDN